MRLLVALIVVGGLALVGWVGGGSAGLAAVFAIAVPYAAIAIFTVGLVARVLRWARSTVPFRIPTSCGQQRSLAWIRRSRFDNPFTGWEAFGRMFLEVVTFRSLFRNSRAELKEGGNLVYGSDKVLWAGALAFHYSFLVIFLRHYRFFVEPVPTVVAWMQGLDGFFQVGVPVIYLTDAVVLAALGYLLLRRLANPQLRYLSLAADYFPLVLLLGIAGSGILLRYVFKTDTVAVKELALGLVTFHPGVPPGLTPLFYVHLLLVCTLFAYFPFSKLSHMAGVFLSPTRNLANNNRAVRHINPWNPPIIGHTYAEWEEEFHDKIKAAGLPLERE
ncbi:MAG: sulfate reduction electron transfer complex DsrMKJOP subunit DsrM [Acidobacteriota bacterium]